MQYQIIPHRLGFKDPFKIAHTERTFTDGAFLGISDGINIGWGEIVFPPYYSESLSSFQQFMAAISWPSKLHKSALREYFDHLLPHYPNDRFAIAALDMALHHLLLTTHQSDLYQYYDLPYLPKPSSITIGISSNTDMDIKIADTKAFEYIKLKVDQSNIERIIGHFTKICDKPFVIDANQGFSDKKQALYWCERLEDLEVAYLEQPFAKDDWESHKWLRQHSGIPIIADESFQRLEDIDTISHCFDGINIKLLKVGGIYAAKKCFEQAQECELKTVLGCMSESITGIEAALPLAGLADWVDLDGAHLLTNGFERPTNESFTQ